MGHCSEDGQNGYLPIAASKEVMEVVAAKLWNRWCWTGIRVCGKKWINTRTIYTDSHLGWRLDCNNISLPNLYRKSSVRSIAALVENFWVWIRDELRAISMDKLRHSSLEPGACWIGCAGSMPMRAGQQSGACWTKRNWSGHPIDRFGRNPPELSGSSPFSHRDSYWWSYRHLWFEVSVHVPTGW